MTLHEAPAVFAELESDWDTLLAVSSAPSIFLTHAWIATWWGVFGAGKRLHVMEVQSASGELLGIAPFFVATGVEGFPEPLRVLMCIGQQGDTLAEELDVIARRGSEAQVAQAVAGHLAATQHDTWDALCFERVRDDSVVMPLLCAELEARRYPGERRVAHTSPFLALPDTMDQLMAGLSRNFRSQIRNARNRLEREGVVEIARAGKAVSVDDAMETLTSLHRKRWGPGDGSFDTDAYIRFHRELSRSFDREGRLLLAELRLDGQPVAARYDFLYAGRIWCFQGGWDPDFERMRPGTLLTAEVLAWGIKQGYAEYAFLSGDDPYKRRWASGARTLSDVVVWGRGRHALASRAGRRLRTFARRVPGLRWIARRLCGRRADPSAPSGA